MQIPHKEILQILNHSLSKGRVSHALLFHGLLGYGGLPLAIGFAAKLIGHEQPETTEKRVLELKHPDLHFCFPVVNTDEVKKPTAAELNPEWISFIQKNPFGKLSDWTAYLGSEKKQGIINVRLAQEIIQRLSLRSHQGGYRVMLIWLPETMNTETANKLLKIIEEPPEKTIFLLVTESTEQLLPTLISRCQLIQIPKLKQEDLENALVNDYDVDPTLVKEVLPISQGNVQVALENLLFETKEFEESFIVWVRSAFLAKKNTEALQTIVKWSENIAGWNRGQQKNFLNFCADLFRQALMQSYGNEALVFKRTKSKDFKWEAFSNFIHGANIVNIQKEINEASYHIDRNANAKIVFLDLGIKLIREIHKGLDS